MSEDLRQEIDDLTQVLSNLTIIIKNIEARVSKLEGKVICPNCNALIEFDEDNNPENQREIYYKCKCCDRITKITNDNGLLNLKLLPPFRCSLSDELNVPEREER